MKHISALLLIVLAAAGVAQAQQGQGGTSTLYTELFTAGSTAVVKGAPFSAVAVSESLQILSDGNKITRSNTSKMYRDSEGRFRRELSAGSGSTGFSYFTSADFSSFFFENSITIFDPVSSLRYVLTPSTKTARQLTVPRSVGEGAVVLNSLPANTVIRGQQVETFSGSQGGAVTVPRLAPVTSVQPVAVGGGNNSKIEPLGTRNIEGVEAEGTRSVTTIPAGAIGNERPIEIVYERWYSKELQLIVYSKLTDLRLGEHTYRLVNINRSEPDRSLFALPADYKVVPGQTFNVVTTKPK